MPYLYSADPDLPLETLQTLLVPVLATQGVGLVELQFRRERFGWVLRVMIENPEGTEPGKGITLDRCAEVSHALSEALDSTDMIQPAYSLEVTSPGIERPLHDSAEYLRFHGLKAKIVLRTPLSEGPLKGQAALVGRLCGVNAEGKPLLEVPVRGGAHQEAISRGDIKLAHLIYDPVGGARGGSAKKNPKSPGKRRQGQGKI